MVIQRWQSVLLFIATIAMATFTFLSLGQVQLPDYSLNFTTLGFSIEGVSTGNAPSGYVFHTWPLFVISLLSALIPLIDIFMFRNLSLQKKLCLIEILFLVATIATGCGYGYCSFDNYSTSWSSVIIAPALALIATIMAYNRINSDQKLLKSVDRIR